MSAASLVTGVFLVFAIVAGTIADRPRPNQTLTIDGYRVLAADFHTHSSMWSDGALTPWGLVLEAERHGLDAIAITGHNEIADAKVGRWFSHIVGGPLVLTGQEILAPGHHVIAVGIDRVVDWHQDVSKQIDEVHAQGGVAIAAHPLPDFWPGFDETAIRRLDGTEICHPSIFVLDDAQRDLERFAARASAAAIGSSDFHGFGPMGVCRTYVFARGNSADAVLDAVRAHRTVVYGLEDKPYGDPELVELSTAHPELRDAVRSESRASWLDWVSRTCGVIGLLVLVAGGIGDGRRRAV